MRFIYVMTLFVSVMSNAWSQGTSGITINQASVEIREIFRQTIELRNNVTNKDDSPVKEWYEEADYSTPGSGFMFEDGMFGLAEILTGNKQSVSTPVYRSAIIMEMSSSDPLYRGLACQLAGLYFDPDSIYALGSLIDDDRPAVAVMTISIPQNGPDIKRWTKPTVGQMARSALADLIYMKFKTGLDFNNWWKANANNTVRLWYWSAKWSKQSNLVWHSTGLSTLEAYLPVHVDDQIITQDLKVLGKMPGDQGLKILLLQDNDKAKRYETFALMGMDERTANDHISVMYRPSDDCVIDFENIAEYAKDHRLKSRLIELMLRKNLYSELNSGGYESLFSKITMICGKLFSSDDEPLMAKMQDSNPDMVRSLALLRVKLTPKRADAILVDTLKKHPQLNELAGKLIRSSGSKYSQVLVQNFRLNTDYGQRELAEAVYNAAKGGLPISAIFIADLAEIMKEPTYDKNGRYFATSDAIWYLVRTANLIKGREVIPIVGMLDADKYREKRPDQEIMDKRAIEYPEVFRTTRITLIKEMRK